MANLLIGPKAAPEVSEEEARIYQGAAARRRARDLALANHWDTFDANEFERGPGRRGRDYLVHKKTGNLFESVRFDVMATVRIGGISEQDIDAYYETPRGGVVFLRRPARGKPQVVGDLIAERDEARRRREEAAEAERAKIAAMPRAAVTAAELAELPNPPTLAEAVRRIEKAGGVVENRDGELVVELAPKAPHRGPAIAGCRVLFAAAPVVLEALEGGAEGLAERLPDVHPRAGGGLT